MRYFYKKPAIYRSVYGEVYTCDHPVYNRCTLFKENGVGLAVIQQRYDSGTKKTWWGEVDPWLANDIYIHLKFQTFFNQRARESVNGLYPTVSVRQIMWALKMKPLPKERWETVFDRKDI